MKKITLSFAAQIVKTFEIPEDEEKLVEIVMKPCSEWTMEEAYFASDYDLYQFIENHSEFKADDILDLEVEDFEEN